MKASFSLAAALATTFAITSYAAQATCSVGNPCPQDAPCCSAYGYCGVGAYCLGGCDPRLSYDLQSCTAAPLCKSADYMLNSLDDVTADTVYLGDASSTNWVSDGQPVVYNNDSILLTMAASTVGTLLSSTHYVWYGKVSATMTTSQGAGVVTAFILMSDVKDEIDFEFIGVDLVDAQSNYFWQGITQEDSAQNLSVTGSNTVESAHTYTIDWQPDYISWYVDNNLLRTKFKNETYNETSMSYNFPQTPARVMLSLWPAGLSTNAQGTIEWAGGLVDWNSPYMQNGYYYAMVKEVTVECYDPPSGYQNDGNKAYYYSSTLGTNNTVVTGDNSTELASFYATGDDPEDNPATVSASSASSTPTGNTVPGGSYGGGSNAGGVANDNDAGSASTSASSSSSTGGTTFQQGGGSSGSSGTSEAPPRIMAGSAVALLGFFVATLML